MKVKTRWMKEDDWEDVLRIENGSFDDPWEIGYFIKTLRGRNVIPLAAEYKSQVIGFMLYCLNRTTFEIVNLAVDQCYRREGVAMQLIDGLKVKLKASKKRAEIIALVREGNLSAHLFFSCDRIGFMATNVLHGVYEESDEDGYLFEYVKSDVENGPFQLYNKSCPHVRSK